MGKYDSYQMFVNNHRTDIRNKKTPYKVIASGILEPLRFESEILAYSFFKKHKGRCLLSYNTDKSVKILAYKFN